MRIAFMVNVLPLLSESFIFDLITGWLDTGYGVDNEFILERFAEKNSSGQERICRG
jgi:hypothetical protein